MMSQRRTLRLAAIAWAGLSLPHAALAGDAPLYQPAPAWIAPVPAMRPADIAAGPALVLLDRQTRLERGTAWVYFDSAVRMDSPEALTRFGTLTGGWSPDKGDLIVHRAVIVRGTDTIDLLAERKFTVLQRERGLERRMMDGTLTATLPVTGLRVGDTLRFTYSVTQSDKALGGHVQNLHALPLPGTPVGFGRMQLSWPKTAHVGWSVGPNVAVPAGAERIDHGYKILTVPLPLPKRDPLPDDAPVRFRRSPLLLAGDFAGWADVSRTIAPLFATEGAIAPGSPLAGEVAAIMAAAPSPRERTAMALQLVQGRISYLLMGMNGGNYVPQQPAETWALRYGDCKAKTLLLLSILRAMGIEAEAVLASSQGGDALPGLLPMPGAFDHVLVRAVVDGQELWLDGTDSNARLADLADVPPLRFVLPLRPQGAGLLPLTWRRPERPFTRLTMTLDETAGIDVPALFDATIELRGAAAAKVALAAAQTSEDKRTDIARAMIGAVFRGAQLTRTAFSADEATGVTTVRVAGIVGPPWVFERGGARHDLDFGQATVSFSPDRARPKWRDLPVAVDGPDATELNLTLRLPDGGRGYALEGDAAFAGDVAGQRIDRNAVLADGVVTAHDRLDQPAGAEVPAADVTAQKERTARYLASTAVVRGPVDAVRRWERAPDGARARYGALDAAYAGAIAAHPDDIEGYANRARFRRGTFDRKGALADFDKAIALQPDAALYAERAAMHEEDGAFAAALADIASALAIDPSSRGLVATRAHLLTLLGRRDEALAVVRTALDNAGRDRAFAIAAYADPLAEAGQAAQALALLEEVRRTRPGNAEVLNALCWIKGTRGLALDTATADCTGAVELAESPGPAFDSRAMVAFRQGRMEAALADLDAALAAVPGLSASLFMRAVVRARLGQEALARADLAAARRLSPAIDRRYAGYGIVAPY